MDRPNEDVHLIAASKELVRMMGRVFATGEMYGPHHRATLDAIESCYRFVTPILDIAERIDFSLSNGLFFFDGETTEKNDTFINTLARWLIEVDLSGFSFLKGLTREEFKKLIEIIFSGVPIADEEGAGMRQALAECGIEHVRSQKVTVCTITEQEEIVLKSAGRVAGREGEEKNIGSVIEQITAFLKGDVEVDPEQDAKNMKAMLLSAPERLARFIMDSATLQKAEAMSSGKLESLTDIVVARLDRIRDVLLKDPAPKTKKRQNDLKKGLLLLGKEILGRLPKSDAPADPERTVKAIEAAIEEMEGELEIQTLIAQYSKKLTSLEKCEKHIVRCIQTVGVERAAESSRGENLTAEGVPAVNWQKLLVKAAGNGTASGSSDAASEIVALLTKLDEMLRIGRTEAEPINGVMSQVTEAVRILASRTEQQIEALGQQIQQLDETIADSKDPRQVKKAIRSRKALIELLADIIEKLCQPVTVMSTAIQMLVEGYLGPVNEQQKETLEMGVASGEIARKLLQRLIDIVGIPHSPPPEEGIIESSVQLTII